jgi:uroporphyrinogen decarboxylase
VIGFFTLPDGHPVDHLVFMPITMMFAAHHIGKKYGKYALDYRLMAEAQVRTAEAYGFDHVSAISETREAPDCGAKVRFYEDQPYSIDERCTLLADKSTLLVSSTVHSNQQLTIFSWIIFPLQFDDIFTG